MSIKPEYANAIFSGKKAYEFRRKIFKRKDVKTIVVYATKPVGKVIGEFTIENIISDIPSAIWFKTSQDAGISESYFNSYFTGVDIGYAIKVGALKKYEMGGFKLSELGVKRPPQSYMYID
ncbi:ASCH domain-containing protein [Aeromonas sp. CU5]|uniref:ASCH domain-containing protein n=1 Tax=Aeromonas sp. CU5 TaxID=2033033 RepID=UPI001C12BE3B|nr:ASCH domain-containing protein [Aeromonas sp. CU5]